MKTYIVKYHRITISLYSSGRLPDESLRYAAALAAIDGDSAYFQTVRVGWHPRDKIKDIEFLNRAGLGTSKRMNDSDIVHGLINS